MTYKEIYEGLQKEANMKKEVTMKVARMIKKARLEKKATPNIADTAYAQLNPTYREYVDLGAFPKGPVGGGLAAVRRQYAPELLEAQKAEPKIKKYLDNVPIQSRGDAVRAILKKIAPGFLRSTERQKAAIDQYKNQVLPHRQNAERLIPKF